jgi:hypothetical protein
VTILMTFVLGGLGGFAGALLAHDRLTGRNRSWFR